MRFYMQPRIPDGISLIQTICGSIFHENRENRNNSVLDKDCSAYDGCVKHISKHKQIRINLAWSYFFIVSVLFWLGKCINFSSLGVFLSLIKTDQNIFKELSGAISWLLFINYKIYKYTHENSARNMEQILETHMGILVID